MEYSFTIFTKNDTGFARASYARQLAEFSEHDLGLVSVTPAHLLCRPYMIVAHPPKSPEAIGGVTVQTAFADEEGLSWQQISTLAVFPDHAGNGLATRLVDLAAAMIQLERNNAYAYFHSDNPPSLSAFRKNGFIDGEVHGRAGVVKYCGQLSLVAG